jgi:PAS domain S-box-containing protein
VEDLAKNIMKEGFLNAHSQNAQANQFLIIIRRLAELVSLDMDLKQICKSLTRIIIEETSFENCSILLWDTEKDCLCLTAAHGLVDLLGPETDVAYNHSLSFDLDEGIAGRAFATGNPIFVENTIVEAIPVRARAIIRPGSLACIPLLDRGVLNISSREPREFPIKSRGDWELVGRIIGYLLLIVSLPQGFRDCPKPVPRLPRETPIQATPTTLYPSELLRLAKEAIDHNPQGICLLDAEGHILQVSKSFERSHGGNGSQFIGRSPALIFHDPQMFRMLLEKVSTLGSEELEDISLVNSNGDVYYADINLVRLSSEARKLEGYLLIVNDTTKKKAFAEKMLQAEKLAALGTMAGGVAHDFNNLLMVMLGNIQLILPQVSDEEIMHRLGRLEQSVHDGANIVRRLMKFTERDKDRQIQTVAADVNEAIRDVVEMTKPRWKNAMEKHGHSILFDLELEPQCYSTMHISDLREILTNLILNAIEAMPKGGTITLKSKVRDDLIVIRVVDTGIGMSHEVAGRVFDPFYTTKGPGNSGLGLSVSWSVVTRSGGEIRVTSKPGKGSAFVITLPRAQAPGGLCEASVSPKAETSQRILIVDDDEDLMGILRDWFRLSGFRVVATTEGKKALDLIENEAFDLVLTDLGMPGISGWEIAARAKGMNSNLPVVLLTGWGEQYEEEDLSIRGVDLVISKPVNWSKLVETVRRFLTP